jgi:hypothetical protein
MQFEGEDRYSWCGDFLGNIHRKNCPVKQDLSLLTMILMNTRNAGTVALKQDIIMLVY